MATAAIYLLDTNIVSDLMRNASSPALLRIQALLAGSQHVQLCTSVVVQCELLFGLQRASSPRWRSRFDEAMVLLQVLPVDDSVCALYAALRTQLEKAGTPIGPNDALIAAHALALGATLVSADAEFLRVQHLVVENWLNGSTSQ